MKRLSLTVFLCLFSLSGLADTFAVQDIRLEGLQRVSAGTVYASLPVTIGEQIDDVGIQEATRALFRSGYFADINMLRDGNVLVVLIKERPAISKINLEGNKAIKTDDLMKGLNDNGLSEGQIFKQATLNGLSQELERQYVGQGRYGAKVETSITELPRNQVELNITIDEGEVAAIKHINIVGNTAFSDEELLDLFELKTTDWFSWLNNKDKYAKEKLSGDIERLESFYLDRGYLNFSIDSSQVSVSPDKESVYITLNISEGDVYTVSDVELAGDLVVDERLVRSLILVKEGQIFSQMLLTTSSDYITQRLGNAGYTFAEVQGYPEANEDDKTVKVTFFINPGKRAYVRRIEFSGNEKTSDEVMRREMRQMEGGSASNARIEQSKVRLERLGYFKEVNVETKEVPGVADQIDVAYTVEEQPSGSISASLGYAQGTGLIIGASVQQDNWFGTGKKVGFSVNRSNYETSYSFNYTDPYFTPDGISRGISLFYRERDYDKINVSSYSTNTYGFNLNFGYPISEIERISLGLGYSNLEVKTGSFAVQEIIGSPRLFDDDRNNVVTVLEYVDSSVLDQLSLLRQGYVDSNGDGVVNTQDERTGTSSSPFDARDYLDVSAFDDTSSKLYATPDGFIDRNGSTFNLFTMNFSWLQSTLNRGRLATRGRSQQFSLEASVPGSELEYYKFIYNAQYFKPLTQSLTLRLRTRLGYADGYGGTDGLPFFENFYAGGFGSVRGFKRNTLGPLSTPANVYTRVVGARIDTDGDGDVDKIENMYVLGENGKLASNVFARNDDPFGGNVLVEFGAEVLFPLPFLKDQRTVQSAFFIDAGNVYNTSCGASQLNCYDLDLARMSVSAGIGVTWISGFGPMTFSIAKALEKQEYDDTEVFQFSLGTAF